MTADTTCTGTDAPTDTIAPRAPAQAPAPAGHAAATSATATATAATSGTATTNGRDIDLDVDVDLALEVHEGWQALAVASLGRLLTRTELAAADHLPVEVALDLFFPHLSPAARHEALSSLA